eukprot:6213969-Pleurochrysis_carterae.AAC.4
MTNSSHQYACKSELACEEASQSVIATPTSKPKVRGHDLAHVAPAKHPAINVGKYDCQPRRNEQTVLRSEDPITHTGICALADAFRAPSTPSTSMRMLHQIQEQTLNGYIPAAESTRKTLIQRQRLNRCATQSIARLIFVDDSRGSSESNMAAMAAACCDGEHACGLHRAGCTRSRRDPSRAVACSET